MAKADIQLRGRAYSIACAPGQEGRIETLSRQRVTSFIATSEQLAELSELLAADMASAEPKYGAPFLNCVVADEAFAAGGSAPSTFAGASVVTANSSLDAEALSRSA